MNLTLIQKFGFAEVVGPAIVGQRKFGVPVGGAFDIESHELANGLVGVDAGAPVWELGMAQARFRCEMPGSVSVIGALAKVLKSDSEWDSNSVFGVASGEEFVVQAPSTGARVYVAWSPMLRSDASPRRLMEAPMSVADRNHLRIVPGPQSELFDLGLLKRGFTVSRTGNRVGVRLDESIGAHKIDLPSEPQCVGAIQVSNDGTPIIIGPDGPTIGGYPKIGVVITSDLSRVGQLRPGESVAFEPVSLEQARDINTEARKAFNKRLSLLRLSLGSL